MILYIVEMMLLKAAPGLDGNRNQKFFVIVDSGLMLQTSASTLLHIRHKRQTSPSQKDVNYKQWLTTTRQAPAVVMYEMPVVTAARSASTLDTVMTIWLWWLWSSTLPSSCCPPRQAALVSAASSPLKIEMWPSLLLHMKGGQEWGAV